MKSLDEVITANECCDHGEPDSRCEDCPYNGIGACCAERESDALHYLKDMKNLEEDYNILYNKYWREFNQQQENPPLTWDELKQMDNVVLSPHTGTGTYEGRVKMCQNVQENILYFLNNELEKMNLVK